MTSLVQIRKSEDFVCGVWSLKCMEPSGEWSSPARVVSGARGKMKELGGVGEEGAKMRRRETWWSRRPWNRGALFQTLCNPEQCEERSLGEDGGSIVKGIPGFCSLHEVGCVQHQLKLLVTLLISAGVSSRPHGRSRSNGSTDGMGKAGLIGLQVGKRQI